MIKFFRTIRQNLLMEKKPSTNTKSSFVAGKYFKYALGEIILVMLGILLALQINIWNESRKLTALETAILQELRDGLVADLEDAELNLNQQYGIYASQNISIDWLESDLTYSDTLAKHFIGIYEGTYFQPNDGAYQNLKQLGLYTINNDSLRTQISKLYGLTYLKYDIQNIEYKRINRTMDAGFSTFFTEVNYLNISKTRPVDIVGLKQDNSFLFSLKTTRTVNQVLIFQTIPKVIIDIRKTISMIDHELRSRNIKLDSQMLEGNVTIEDSILESYKGEYEVAPGFVISVTKAGNKTLFLLPGQDQVEIFPKSENVFYLLELVAEVTFNEGEDGEVESLTFMTVAEGGQEFIAKKL